MKKSICMAVAALVVLAIATVALATVTPTVLLNGNHYTQVWRPEYTAPTLSIQIATDEACVPVDYFLLCLTPSGWKYYHALCGYWYDGYYPVAQGCLTSFGEIPLPISGIDTTQSGTYSFIFGVDKTQDGLISADIIYDIVSINVIPEGKSVVVTIYDTMQTVGFDLSSGYINGFVVNGDPRAIASWEVAYAMEVSDRVGWVGNSTAITTFSQSGLEWIPNTANSDKAQWVLYLNDGSVAWLNLDEVVFAGKTTTRTGDDLIQYGSYRPQIIYFENGQSYIDFACNLTGGFVIQVSPSDIDYLRWNSDETGWNEYATVTGKLYVDGYGNYYAWFSGSVTGSGLFSVVLKDGSVVWMNIDNWTLSGATKSGERIVVN